MMRPQHISPIDERQEWPNYTVSSPFAFADDKFPRIQFTQPRTAQAEQMHRLRADPRFIVCCFHAEVGFEFFENFQISNKLAINN